MQRAFVDLDEVTAEVMKVPTAAAGIAEQGLSAFRLAEVSALEHTMESKHASVIALGGGTPTAPGAKDRIRLASEKGNVLVIYVRAQPSTLQERLRKTDPGTRPSLTGASVVDEVPVLFAQRDEMYRGLATCVLDVDTMDEPQALSSLMLLASRAASRSD